MRQSSLTVTVDVHCPYIMAGTRHGVDGLAKQFLFTDIIMLYNIIGSAKAWEETG